MKTRDSYKPSAYTMRIFKEELGIEIYIYNSVRTGQPCAIGWNGKRQVKPAFHYNFHNEQAREAHVTKFIADAIAASAKRQERNAGHSLQVGDILNSSFGYDQTNQYFYEVVAVHGTRFISVMKLDTNSEPTGDMTAKETPIQGSYKGDAIRRKVVNNGVYITDYNFAGRWDNLPKHSSSYA